MEAIRQIIDLKKLSGIISIPEGFDHPKVEILVLPVNEDTQNKQVLHESRKYSHFSPEKFYGISSIKNPDDAIRQMRDEWTRL